VTKTQAEEYTQALSQVVAGGWRQISLGADLGVPKALGLTVEEWVHGRLGGYVKLSVEEGTTAAKELKAEGKTEREISSVTGMSPATVHRRLTASNEARNDREPGQLEHIASNEAEPMDTITAIVGTSAMREAAEAAVASPHVSHNNGDNEWYTPKLFIDAARAAMGPIDLDPASTAVANEIVGAEKFYTVDDDGLSKTWHGNVWLNPPYAQPLIAQFSETICKRYAAKEINRACVLVNNATETVWFQRMLELASAVCFVRGRVKFLDVQGEPTGMPLQGQAVIYLGEDPSRFAISFGELGHVTWNGAWVEAAAAREQVALTTVRDRAEHFRRTAEALDARLRAADPTFGKLPPKERDV
jgi:ParB family chromosome partitioning protein